MIALPRVLIVEDNPGDVFLFEECLRESRTNIDLQVAREVDEGMTFLAPGQPVPCLTLVDLHLPRRDGRQLLMFVREQSYLAGMPAVVLSSSQRPADHDACLSLGAREVLIKPYDWNGYAQLVANLSRYWATPSVT